jgi:restriction endonuclease S subunit
VVLEEYFYNDFERFSNDFCLKSDGIYNTWYITPASRAMDTETANLLFQLLYVRQHAHVVQPKSRRVADSLSIDDRFS